MKKIAVLVLSAILILCMGMMGCMVAADAEVTEALGPDWTCIMVTALTFISAVMTSFLIPLIRSRVDADKLKKFDYWLRLLIEAAETAFPDRSQGALKAAQVAERLKEKGLRFDEETVREAINALCRELTADGVINTDK